jgi:hypothetical protein
MDDPDMIACVDRDARDGADEPVVGEWLRPHRVDLIGRHLAHRRRLRGAQHRDRCEDGNEPEHAEDGSAAYPKGVSTNVHHIRA